MTALQHVTITEREKDVWAVQFTGGVNFFDTETAAMTYAIAVEAFIASSLRIERKVQASYEKTP